MTTLCILGRQPHLGLAELESLYGAKEVEPLGSEAALLNINPNNIDQDQLGGAIKVANLLTILNTTKWHSIVDRISPVLLELIKEIPEGKITFGMSTYDIPTTAAQINRSALELKKVIKQTGHPARVVPNIKTILNSAQVLHNNLTDSSGIELIFVADRGRTYVARTISTQDVERYGERDFGRPKRDARVGMLSPKLAQIMLNLAKPELGSPVLDPFCGTGVVLMEAALRGQSLVGSDLNERMIDFTRTNLDWLMKRYDIHPQILGISTADATRQKWHKAVSCVVTETYLGRPLTALPDQATLQGIVHDCNTIIKAFLINLYNQLAPEARCCIAIPAWKTRNGFVHLPVIDDLKKIGYNRVSFSHAHQNDLLYHRPDQVVARELLVLTR